jgi:methyl-accepting chemotaxis protein
MSAVGGMSIRAKLTVLLVAGSLLGAAAGLWNLVNFQSAASAFQVASRQDLPSVSALVEADRDMLRTQVAERSLMFVRQASEEAAAMRKQHAEGLASARARWEAYKAIPAGEEERRRWPEFERAYAEWESTSREVMDLLAQDNGDARKDAIDLSMSEGAGRFEKAHKVLTSLGGVRIDAAARFSESVERSAARTTWLTLLVSLGLVMAGGGAGLIVSGIITGPLRRTVSVLGDLARGEGDLTIRLPADTGDEVGEVAAGFNLFMDKLHDIMVQVRGAAGQAGGASRELSVAAEQLAAGAQEQASSLEETAASLEEITGTVRQNADNAKQANQLAVGAREVAEKGGQVVAAAVGSMREINRASKKIADIITTIDEIAFQTNLLALNAAVEAARAGEQGRGFAVVAAEVRNLAQRSALAAKEIRGLIQDSVQKVEAGSELVNRSGETLKEIEGSVKRVTDIIAEIAAASQEQTAGVDQVSRAVTQMDQVTQANAAQTEGLSSTAQALAAQAEQMAALVGRFKLAVAAGPEVASHKAVGVLARTGRAERPGRHVTDAKSRGLRRTDGPLPAAARTGNGHHKDDGFEEF